MKAIILAAGQGTRLKKYTENLPKGMLMFNSKTIIERQIEEYRAAGIKDIIVVRGFAADKIQYEGVKYYTNEKFATTNMVESLMAAREEFGDDCIVSYSDILFTQEMLKGMMAEPHDFTVAVDDNWKAYWQARYGRVDFDTESLEIDANDNILSLGQEAPNIDEISARYIGLLKFSKNGLKHIVDILERDYPKFEDKPWMLSGKHIRQAYMTDLLMALIKDGYEVKASHYQNGWVEFDTNEDYETACEWVKSGKIKEFLKEEDCRYPIVSLTGCSAESISDYMRSIQLDLFLRGIDTSGPDKYYVGITKDVDDNHKRHKIEKFDGRNFQYIIVCKCNTAEIAAEAEWKMKLKGYNIGNTDKKGNGGDKESVYVYMFKLPN